MSLHHAIEKCLLVLAGSTLLTSAPLIQAQNADGHPGQVVYEDHCALCHEGGDPRAATREVLHSMTVESLAYALSSGAMSVQGQNLSDRERSDVVHFLAAADHGDEWLVNNYCSGERQGVSLQGTEIVSAGSDPSFSRNLDERTAGLSKADMQDLELAWALGFPGVSGLRSSPVFVGSTLFYPAGASGRLLALDAESGCILWDYDAGAPLRSSATLGDQLEDGRRPLFVSDEWARLHAVDARTGEAMWTISGAVDPEAATRLTGAMLAWRDRVYVPVSASGVQRAADPLHECCDGRGAVIALDAASGERIWTWYTMGPAQYTGERNAADARLRGPSGAPIWSSPSMDESRGHLYVTTGENTSLPATSTSNAIIALDLDTGEQQWLFQAVADDVWNMACTGATPGPNCPDAEDSIRKDWDFGGPAIPVTTADGRDLLLAGQKSGHLWAIDPDDGSLIWEQRVGEGGALGGNHWGIALDGDRVFLPISDPHYASMTDDMVHAGVYAFDIASGERLWDFHAVPDCAEGRDIRVPSCQVRYGFSAKPLVVDGALVAGNIDGRLFVFDGEDGSVLFEFDTAQTFTTVNQVEGAGGSIDAHSVSAGAGMLFVGSGYERFRQETGNVLLGLRPKSSE